MLAAPWRCQGEIEGVTTLSLGSEYIRLKGVILMLWHSGSGDIGGKPTSIFVVIFDAPSRRSVYSRRLRLRQIAIISYGGVFHRTSCRRQSLIGSRLQVKPDSRAGNEIDRIVSA